MPLKWGIAASGRIANDFVNAIGTIDGNHHEIVAVADIKLKFAQNFAEKYNIKKFYEGFEDLANDPDIDIVYVGTLNPYHYTVTRLMLEYGKNVLCEKPICLCYEDAKHLYELAAKKNVFLMEAMWSRCFPSYKRLIEILDSNEIGDICEVQVSHGFKALDVERITTRSLGGGITLDIGIYTVQLAQFIFKKYPRKISATGKLVGGVDIESEITLEYDNGAQLLAKVSGLKDLDNKAIIRGSKGQITVFNFKVEISLVIIIFNDFFFLFKL